MKIPFFISLSVLVASCISSKIDQDQKVQQVKIYSYVDLGRELDEDSRFLNKVLTYKGTRLFSEVELVKNGDTSQTHTHFYNAQGLKDSTQWFVKGEWLSLIYTYDSSALLFKTHQVWRNKWSLTEHHFRTDSIHKIKSFLGGRLSHIQYLSYDEEGDLVKREYFSPQGDEYWGHLSYKYNQNGKLTDILDFNKNDIIQSHEINTYDKKGRLEWKISSDAQGKTVVKQKYEYH